MVDVTAAKWYGKLQLPGIGQPQIFRGSIVEIYSEMLVAMKQSNARTSRSGEALQITIHFRNQPFVNNAEKEINEKQNQLEEVTQSLLAANPDIPMLSDEEEAAMYAQYPWMKDDEYQRFAYLNATQRNFEEALPGEYLELVRRLELKYPEHMKQRTLRTL